MENDNTKRTRYVFDFSFMPKFIKDNTELFILNCIKYKGKIMSVIMNDFFYDAVEDFDTSLITPEMFSSDCFRLKKDTYCLYLRENTDIRGDCGVICYAYIITFTFKKKQIDNVRLFTIEDSTKEGWRPEEVMPFRVILYEIENDKRKFIDNTNRYILHNIFIIDKIIKNKKAGKFNGNNEPERKLNPLFRKWTEEDLKEFEDIDIQEFDLDSAKKKEMQEIAETIS